MAIHIFYFLTLIQNSGIKKSGILA